MIKTTNEEFYPTPQDVIEKMLDGVKLKNDHDILEPSAGDGRIADYLVKKYEKYPYYCNQIKERIDCIELDPDLRHILKGKGFRVIHDDFFTYETQKEYDLIIMNPPFSNGCTHLLKAIKMQERNGGSVICLLNAETIRNPYTNERKVLKQQLEDYSADIQFFTEAFSEAERTTNVEIALIRIKLPEVKRESVIFDRLRKAQEYEEIHVNSSETQLADADFFKAIVNQYNLEIEAGKQLIQEYYAMKPYILEAFEKDDVTGRTIQTGSGCLELKVGKSDATINRFVKAIRKKYWTALFKNPKFSGQLTSNLQDDYYNQIHKLIDYEFSLYNIYDIKMDMSKKIIEGIKQSIIHLFDEFSRKYSYYDETSKNIHYFNGWKTNKSWIVNKKVIIPLNAWNSWRGYYPSSWDLGRTLADIEKCFNYLDGGLTMTVDLYSVLRMAENVGQTKNLHFKYFDITFYKKGTCHITFRNEELLKKFNIFGAQNKCWLPPAYGNKKYSDMSEEEKQVIDSFEGEEAYNQVMSHADYYLTKESDFLIEMQE